MYFCISFFIAMIDRLVTPRPRMFSMA